MVTWIAPPKGGYQAKAPEIKVGSTVQVKDDVAGYGGLVGKVENSIMGAFDWRVELAGQPLPLSIKFKNKELTLIEPERVPPKNPASSSQPADTYRSTESLLGEILEVLKEIREQLKPKAPAPFGNRGMGAIPEWDTGERVTSTIPEKRLAGSVEIGMKIILSDGAIAVVKDKWRLKGYAVPTMYFVTQLMSGAKGQNCFSFPDSKELDVFW